MKQIIVAILCMVMIVTMSTGTVFASSEDGVLVLPEDDGTGYPVTGITDSYNNNDEVSKVVVPENIIRLGDRAFFGCSSLNQIKLHGGIQRIGEQAFDGTAYYKDPDNWEDGVLYIGDCLIKGNPDEMTDTYKIRNGTRLIADGAFKNCENLNTIIVPDTIEYVGAEAFIGTGYFSNPENWSNNSLVLDYLLISVDKEYAGALSVLDGIRTIADGAFSHSKVTEVVTPDSLKHIGNDAFWDCQELVRVSIAREVETLGRGPFRMCTELKTITVHEENEHYTVVDGVLYNKQLSAVIRCPHKLTGKVVLPHSIKKINAYAFAWCTEIESVEIPEGCVFIGNSAFYLCEKLNNIILPQTTEYIDNSAFSCCNSLESIVVPDNVYYLGRYAFNSCINLKEVEIGDGVEELRYCLFESCEKLNKVTLGENIKEINDTAFLFTRYISNISNYQNGLLVSSDKYLIKVTQDVTACYIPAGITLIADGAFEYPSEEGYLSEIHVPFSVKCFNWGAFHEIPETVPVYYDGSIDDFIDITDFDWDCINLYTSDFGATVWTAVILSGVFIIFVVGVIITNYIKRKQDSNTEVEEEYGEE